MQKNTSYLSLKTDTIITKVTRPFYSASLNCLSFALTQARTRLLNLKLTTDFLIASCGSSSHIINYMFAKQTLFT